MKTAIKVINDRINILQQFIEKNKESKEPGVKVHRDSAVSVMLLFSQLQDAIDEHSRLTNAGQVNEELVDTIKELLSQTMVPLIERNKQIIASYNDMLGVLMEKRNKLSVGQVGSTPELDDVNATILLYETSKTSTIDFLSEYEVAFEEIKEMLIGDEVQSAINIATQETAHQEIYEDLKSTLLVEQPPLREQEAVKKYIILSYDDLTGNFIGYLSAFSAGGDNQFAPQMHQAILFDKESDCIYSHGQDWEEGRSGKKGHYEIREISPSLFPLPFNVPVIPDVPEVSEEESISASIPQEITEDQDSLDKPKFEPKIYDANSNENSNENDEVN